MSPLDYYRARSAPARLLHALSYRVRDSLLWERRYARLRSPKEATGIADGPQIEGTIVHQLVDTGLTVQERELSAVGYRDYLARAGYERYPHYLNGGRAPQCAEKSLEHYIAASLLNLTPEDVYIDIANDRSPAPDIYHALYGCTAYRQDLVFRPGLHGDTIGGNAADLPLDDGFATALCLHCSFEHFEGDSDWQFIREASRVLKPGGRLCIVPLYLSTEYSVLTDPAVLPRDCSFFEPDAVLHCVRGYGNRHGRFYDAVHLVSRIVPRLGPLQLTVQYLTNVTDVVGDGYVRFAAMMVKH